MIQKQIIVNHSMAETRVALVERDQVTELYIERHSDRGLIGNIYKGGILRVLPGMQSAFVDIGEMRSGFLYVTDVLSDEFIAQSRKFLAESNEDLTHGELEHELEKKMKWTKIAIGRLLRDGQTVMVQVSKEPLGNKGARLSMFITFPGRYLVLSPHFNHVGVSKKIEDEAERKRLKAIFAPLKPENMAVIVRTAARGISEDILSREMLYLIEQWRCVQEKYSSSACPSLLHRDLDLTQRIIREQYSEDVGKIVVDDAKLYEKIGRMLVATSPEAEAKLELYRDATPIFDVYGIEMDIGRALSKRVDLPSGGYVVIDQAEALTTIDINTGRYVGRSNVAETVFKTNLEAVKKVVAQIRLRNIGGIIVIDFIDMEKLVDREIIFNALLEELKTDRARTNVLKISDLGLVQMTRKRSSESLEHLLLDECPHCEGRGKVKSVVTSAHDLLRELVRVHNQSGKTLLQARVREDIRDWILEEEREWFQEIVDRWGLTVNFKQGEMTISALSEAPFEVQAE
jgi:ribonuclease G